jgi:hypothetical protein
MCDSHVNGCQFAAWVVVKAHSTFLNDRPAWTRRFSVTYKVSSHKRKGNLEVGRNTRKVPATRRKGMINPLFFGIDHLAPLEGWYLLPYAIPTVFIGKTGRSYSTFIRRKVYHLRTGSGSQEEGG